MATTGLEHLRRYWTRRQGGVWAVPRPCVVVHGVPAQPLVESLKFEQEDFWVALESTGNSPAEVKAIRILCRDEYLGVREELSLRLTFSDASAAKRLLSTGAFFFGTHCPDFIPAGLPRLRSPLAPSAIYLEGLISVHDFENQTGTLAPYFVHTEKENRKRKDSQTIHNPATSELSSLKRTRGRLSAPLSLRSDFGSVPGFSKIAFAFASVSVAQNGAVTFEWPDLKDHEKTTISPCLLQDAPFDRGKTKMVYKVILDGLPWVAKRFFNIGAGEGLVDIQENHDQVVKEVTRLSRASYFLTRFIAEAQRQGVDIDQVENFDRNDGGQTCPPDSAGQTAPPWALNGLVFSVFSSGLQDVPSVEDVLHDFTSSELPPADSLQVILPAVHHSVNPVKDIHCTGVVDTNALVRCLDAASGTFRKQSE
ncbi:hypothetical protein B0H11DRAFT_2194139 [Mycena galericulata]|nr:hypothetical protein B0H11DRAFT_2194139 [Mycena galericulata]